jgi:hypothetical protein
MTITYSYITQTAMKTFYGLPEIIWDMKLESFSFLLLESGSKKGKGMGCY